MHVKYVLVAVLAVVAVTATGFAVDTGVDSRTSAVSFDETLTLGLAGVDVQEAEAAGYHVPKTEVFYSQFQYVVGYYGVDAAATHLVTPGTGEQFGRPLSVLVTDYANAAPNLTREGYVRLDNEIGLRWVQASEAWFVVDSPARTPGGPAVLPFGDRDAARAFVDEHGGEVVDWDGVLARAGEEAADPVETRTRIVDNRTAWADRQVTAAADLRDRPTSVVVGEDAPTLAAGIERAPPNTTVAVPAGTYDANLTVEKPVTISGAGPDTHLQGPGTGTVVQVKSPRVAITDLRVSGVGPNGSSSVADVESDDWDARVRVAYGTGDAAIRFDNATGSLVDGVEIDTPATGMLIRYSPGVVVSDSTVRGTETPTDGFMGALAMYDPVVVQNSTFRGGRDGVYTHRTPGIVVRDNRMLGMRYGVHEMYTSRALVTDNTIRDTRAGVIVMTRPRRNVLLGNDVRGSDMGISVAGSASFVADNTVTDNGIGISVGATRSLVDGNVVVGNDLGVRADTLMPSTDVVRNDIVANERQVEARRGPIRVWTRDRGNYWGDLPGRDDDRDGTLDTAYYPTDDLDRSLLRAPGAVTLRESPAVGTYRSVQNAVPGLRASGIVDRAPLVEPVHPNRLATLNRSNP
jgi:nitrous oxidase accessory protein NosD/nitrous oxide reductase accessory protein NosL